MRNVRSCKKIGQNGLKSLRAAYKTEIFVGNLQIYFRLFSKLVLLHGFLTQDGMKEILEGKNYKTINMMFALTADLLKELLAIATMDH